MTGELSFLAGLCNAVHNATYGTVSLCLVVSLSAYYAMEKNFSKSFLDTYVVMGGCGTTICALFAILLFVKKRKRLDNIAKMAVFPAVFNINEVLVFGIPIVLNPVMEIPFLLVPRFCGGCAASANFDYHGCGNLYSFPEV